MSKSFQLACTPRVELSPLLSAEPSTHQAFLGHTVIFPQALHRSTSPPASDHRPSSSSQDIHQFARFFAPILRQDRIFHSSSCMVSCLSFLLSSLLVWIQVFHLFPFPTRFLHLILFHTTFPSPSRPRQFPSLIHLFALTLPKSSRTSYIPFLLPSYLLSILRCFFTYPDHYLSSLFTLHASHSLHLTHVLITILFTT